MFVLFKSIPYEDKLATNHMTHKTTTRLKTRRSRIISLKIGFWLILRWPFDPLRILVIWFLITDLHSRIQKDGRQNCLASILQWRMGADSSIRRQRSFRGQSGSKLTEYFLFQSQHHVELPDTQFQQFELSFVHFFSFFEVYPEKQCFLRRCISTKVLGKQHQGWKCFPETPFAGIRNSRWDSRKPYKVRISRNDRINQILNL